MVCVSVVSSGSAAGSVISSSVGQSLTALTTTSNVFWIVSVPPPPSETVTVTVAAPVPFSTGV